MIEKTKAEVSHLVTLSREGIMPLDSHRTNLLRLDQRNIFPHVKNHAHGDGARQIERLLIDPALQRQLTTSSPDRPLILAAFHPPGKCSLQEAGVTLSFDVDTEDVFGQAFGFEADPEISSWTN